MPTAHGAGRQTGQIPRNRKFPIVKIWETKSRAVKLSWKFSEGFAESYVLNVLKFYIGR